MADLNDTDPNRDRRPGAAVSPGSRDRDRRRPLLWLLAALAAVILIVLLARACDESMDPNAPAGPAGASGAAADARLAEEGDPMLADARPYSRGDFDTYLGGTEPMGRAFTLDRVTFASGSDAIDAGGREEIADLAAALGRYPGARVALTGFADPEGDAAANQALSQRRAEAVRAALVEAGAATGAVTLAAAGETGTAPVRANRKVEVRVTSR